MLRFAFAASIAPMFGFAACPGQDVAALRKTAIQAMANRSWRDALPPLVELTTIDGSHHAWTKTVLLRTLAKLQEVDDDADLPAIRDAFRALLAVMRADGEAARYDFGLHQSNLGCVLMNLGSLREAEATLRDALRTFDEVGHRGPMLDQTKLNLAACLVDLGDASDLDEAWQLVQGVRLPDDSALGPRDLQALSAITELHLLTGRTQQALAMVKRALPLLPADARKPAFTAVHRQHVEVLLAAGQPSAALESTDAVLPELQKARGGDHPDVAMFLAKRGQCLQELGDDIAARSAAEQSLQMYERLYEGDHPDKGLALSLVATVLMNSGAFERAVAVAEELVALGDRIHDGDHVERARSSSTLGLALLKAGRARDAVSRLETALAMRRRLFQGDHPDIARSLDALGGAHQALGQFARALGEHQEALGIRQRTLHPDHPLLADSHNCIGNCLLALGRYEEACAAFAAAVSATERVFGPRNRDGRTYADNLGSALAILGRDEEARRLRDECLAQARDRYPNGHPDVVRALNNSALQSFDTRPAHAIELLEEALAMQSRLQPNHPIVTTLLLHRGQAHEALGNLDAALADYRRGLELEHANRIGDHPDVVLLEASIARCLLRADRHDDDPEPHLATAIEMTERLRADASVLDPATRTDFLLRLKRSRVYERMRLLQADRGRLDRVVDVAELARSRELLDLLQHGERDALAIARSEAERSNDRAATEAIDRLLIEQASNLQAITRLQRQLLDGAGRPADAEVRTDLERARSRRRDLLGEEARIGALVGPPAVPARAAEIQAELRPGELLLRYVVDESAGMVLVVPPAGQPIEMSSLAASRDELARRVAGWRREVEAAAGAGERGRDPPAAATESAVAESDTAKLSRLLLPDSAWRRIAAATRVFVVADGPLQRLAFETLLVGDGAARDAMWIDRGPPIAYVPSATTMVWLRKRAITPSPSPELEVVAVGDVDFSGHRPRATNDGRTAGDRDDFLPLPGTRAELDAIESLLPQPKRLRLQGAAATEASVFAAAPRAAVLHLATHGLGEELAGSSLSALVLAVPASPADDDDGLLRLEELLLRWRQRLRGCRLVVLSACRSAVGDQVLEEATAALPTGFLGAGARSVVASLWNVNDRSTAELMTAFYRRMFEPGSSTDRLRSLHEAKRELRRHYGAYHWAPFLYFGSPD